LCRAPRDLWRFFGSGRWVVRRRVLQRFFCAFSFSLCGCQPPEPVLLYMGLLSLPGKLRYMGLLSLRGGAAASSLLRCRPAQLPRATAARLARHRSSGAAPSPAGDEDDRDAYQVLGVTRRVREGELRAAYKALAKEWHPDRHQGSGREAAERRFQEVAEAFQLLSDPEACRAERAWVAGLCVGSGGPHAPARVDSLSPSSSLHSRGSRLLHSRGSCSLLRPARSALPRRASCTTRSSRRQLTRPSGARRRRGSAPLPGTRRW